MKKLYNLIGLFLLINGYCFAQCAEPPVERVMLIGDSWAAMMGTDNTINSVLQTWGHSGYKFYTNSTLSENGTRTTDFIQPARLTEIQNQLIARPTIDFVHVSLGGNDVLNQWHKTWSQAKTDSLLDSVKARLVILFDFIKTVRPDVRIFWSGYAYPNFGEIIGEMAPFQSTHPFYATWNGMGQPNFVELNGLLNYFSDAMTVLANSDPQLDFVVSTGVMQYTFGQTANLSVPPGGNYPAFTAPLPLGFPNYPSPKNSMRNYVLFRDCFHLSPQGFSDFVNYHTQKFYHKAMMDDQYFISTGGTQDGSVSSLGNTSSALQVGSAAGEDFSTILTFNTTQMPDTGASKASLFLRRASLTGANPIGPNMQLTIVSGNFGATVDVEATDYTAMGNMSGVPCQFGTANANGGWVRLDIPNDLLPYIQQTAITQFKLSAPGASGLVTFTDASDPEFAPVLNITYGINTVGIPVVHHHAEYSVFPNPTSGVVYIETGQKLVDRVEILDITGKLISHAGLSQSSSLDISELPSGVYLLRIYSDGNAPIVRRVSKR
jgi:hypothetical protein